MSTAEREQLPAGQETLSALLGTLIFIFHAYMSVEDLFLFHVKGGKRKTSESPTRLSVLDEKLNQLLS